MASKPTTPSYSVKIEGLKSTVRQLSKLDPNVTVAIKEVSKKAVGIVAGKARARIHRRTSALANTIREGVTKYGATVKMGSSSVPYAMVYHFGWPAHNYPADKVLYAALDDSKAEIVGLYETGVHEIVERTFHPEAD